MTDTFAIEDVTAQFALEDEGGTTIVLQESLFRGAFQGDKGDPGDSGAGGGVTRLGGIASEIVTDDTLMLYNDKGVFVATDVTSLTNTTFLLAATCQLVDTSFHSFINLRDAPDGTYASDGGQIDGSQNVIGVVVDGHCSVSVLGGQFDNTSDRIYFADENISGHTWVTLDNVGALVKASAGVSGHAGRVLGLTLGAIASGDSGPVRPLGELFESTFNFDITKPIWLGLNGASTQVPPTVANGYAFSQIVARPAQPDYIEISLTNDPILLSS